MGSKGRPSKYTKELGKLICKRISDGESVRNICLDATMPSSSMIYRWLLHPKYLSFREQYARSRDIQAEQMFEELLNIADDGENDYMTITKGDVSYNVEDREVTNRSKLRVETRKWYLSKVLPKKFGDKLDLTSAGEKLERPIIPLDVSRNQRNEKDSSAK